PFGASYSTPASLDRLGDWDPAGPRWVVWPFPAQNLRLNMMPCKRQNRAGHAEGTCIILGVGRASQLPQRIELRHVAGRIDARGDQRCAVRFERGRERVAQRLFGLHHDGISAERLTELLPIHAADMDAVRRNPLDLLLDADEADLLVIEDENDDGQLLARCRLQFGN